MPPPAEPPSHWDALKHFRWIQPYDYMMGVFFFFGTLGTMWAFLNAAGTSTSSFMFFVLTCSQLWIVSLLFRCSFFVVQLLAKCKLLPDQTARGMVAYVQKQPIPAFDDDIKFAFSKQQISALIDIGWLKRYDFVALTLVVIGWLSSVVLTIQHIFDWVPFALGAVFFVTTAWSVVLTFRASWFVLQVFAEINSVPKEAMKLIYLFERKT